MRWEDVSRKLAGNCALTGQLQEEYRALVEALKKEKSPHPMTKTEVQPQ